MAYFQTPFTWNDLADAALKPPLRIVNARILNKLDKLQGYRVERPQAALDLAAEMQKRGVLRLALHAGNATLLCADFGQQDSAWMREFRVWHTCRVSRKHHAACPVLFTAQEIPKVIAGKRGPCLGWTQRTLKTNRDRCNALAELGIIAGAVTIAPLPSKCPPRLHRFQKAIQRLLANLGIAHHGCWEGPEPHMHILLCSPMDASTERELRNACFGLYRNHFGYSPVPSPSLVEIDLQLERGQQAAAR